MTDQFEETLYVIEVLDDEGEWRPDCYDGGGIAKYDTAEEAFSVIDFWQADGVLEREKARVMREVVTYVEVQRPA